MTPEQRALLRDVAAACVESILIDAGINAGPRQRRPMRCDTCGRERIGCKATRCRCGGWIKYVETITLKPTARP